MRHKLALAALGFVALWFVGEVRSDDTLPAVEVRQISQEELVELGHEVARVDLYRDNFYQYESQVQLLTETAIAMEGHDVEVLLRVRRVTPGEVLVEPVDAGRTRMILKHATPPFFGNLGTVWYCAQPSANYWNMLAKPIGLRIGDEISLDIAKELRERDTIRVSGRIETMPIAMKHVFEPRVAAVVGGWKVVEVIADDRRDGVRY